MAQTQSAAPSPSRLTIWEASPALWGAQIGYLVTPTSKPDEPLALVVTPGGHDAEGALKLVRRILRWPDDEWDAFPTSSPDNDSAYVVDLRPYGQPDSPLPLPQYMFGLHVRQVDTKGQPVTEEEPLELWPVCWHRAAQMSEGLRQTLPNP